MNDSKQLRKLISSCLADDGLGLLVFAGAGASVEPPTCFPTSTTLTATIIRALCSTHPLVAKRSERYVELTKPIRLEVMLDILLDRVGAEVMNCLRGYSRDAIPNQVHQSVTNLVAKVGKGSLIATTNFDCMFEKALTSRCIPFKQSIALPTVGFNSQTSHHLEVIKIHGSVSAKDGADTFHTLQAAITHVGRPVRPEFRDRFLHLLRNRHVIVIGYSGLDDFDLRDLWIAAGSDARGSLIWVHHTNDQDATPQATRICGAWGPSGRLIRCHTSQVLCETAEIPWTEPTSPACNFESDWFSDFVFDPRIRDLALHGLVRILIHVSTMGASPVRIAKEVEWLLESSRELETLQATRRRYWAIKDQAHNLPSTEKRHHFVRAVGILSDIVIPGRVDEVIPSFERSVGLRELAWGIKDLSAPGETWQNRPEECQQLTDLFERSFELAQTDLEQLPTSPRLLEHYVHAARDHGWGLLFNKQREQAIALLRQVLEGTIDHPALNASWHADPLRDQIANTEEDLARFLTMQGLWNDASHHYREAAKLFKAIGRLVKYWACLGCAAASQSDPEGFERACVELDTLQAKSALGRLVRKEKEWKEQRKRPQHESLPKEDT